jgi:Ca2+-binding EF-hand superfamily protein
MTFKEADVDGDGSINYAEFFSMVSRLFLKRSHFGLK